MPIPVLTTDRTTLRPFRAADWDACAAINADPTVRGWLGGTIMTRQQSWTQMEALLGQWALRGYGVFALEADGRLIGRVGILHPVDWPEPELSWTLAPVAWGHGLATEAAMCVRDWAFATFPWDRLVSYIESTNIRSRRVAIKLGAARQDRITLRGLTADVWIHPAPGRGVVV